MLYETAWNELLSSVPKLDALNAQKLVNRAWRYIRDRRRWSFLLSETVLITPAAITTGTVSVTQNSATVVADSSAGTALAAVGASITDRQFRLGLGPVYNITAFSNPNLTLDSVYGETTASSQTYSVYQSYYEAPAEFLRWESVVDPVSAYTFSLDWTKEEIDRVDPQRGAVNQPFRLASYKYNSTDGSYLFEMWPVPTQFRRYPALYQKRGSDLASGQSQPSIIPDELLMCKARSMAYEWAHSNSGKHPELRNVNWMNLRLAAEAEFKELMNDAKRQDEEIFVTNFAGNYVYPAPAFGYGANYWQTHAPIWSY